MSSRALRRAQKQLEETNKPEDDGESDSSEDQPVPAGRSGFSALAMLEDGGEAGEEESSPEDAHNQKPDEGIEPESQSNQHPSTSSKKKRKKKKKKQPDATKSHQPATTKEQYDEIDAALKQLAEVTLQQPDANSASPVDQGVAQLCKAISIDTQHLHPANEMRRLFGRAAMEDGQGGNDADAGRRGARNGADQAGIGAAVAGRRGGNSKLAGLALRRNIFVQGKEEWPQASSGGLGMEIVDKDDQGVVTYSYVHSKAYQEVQRQFAICVEAGDPQQMVRHLAQNPYHISSLLQVSEIAKNMERDYATAGDLLERALFAMGRSIHSTFAKTLAQGKARLDFRRPENREFWLAGLRYMDNLGMRSTWRTVFEWAKLLLSLDWRRDPYCMRLVIDQYAIRARQPAQVVELISNVIEPAYLEACPPHIAYSYGLALVQTGEAALGRDKLKQAMQAKPWIATRLFQELNLEPVPPAIWGKQPPSDLDHVFSELYASRAKDIWNTPEATSLLMSVGHSADKEVTSTAQASKGDIDLDIARHVVLTEKPELIALVPRQFTSQMTSVSDPLPPEDATSAYSVDRLPQDDDRNMLLNDDLRGELQRLQRDIEAIGPRIGFFPEEVEEGTEREQSDPEDSDGTAPPPQVRRRTQERVEVTGGHLPSLRRLADDINQFLARGGNAEVIVDTLRALHARASADEPSTIEGQVRTSEAGNTDHEENESQNNPHHARVEDAADGD